MKVAICNCCTQYNPQRIGKGTGGIGNKRTSGDHLNYSIIKINQNTEKSPADLRRLTIIQTPEKKHQLMLVGITLKRLKQNKKQIIVIKKTMGQL